LFRESKPSRKPRSGSRGLSYVARISASRAALPGARKTQTNCSPESAADLQRFGECGDPPRERSRATARPDERVTVAALSRSELAEGEDGLPRRGDRLGLRDEPRPLGAATRGFPLSS